jgi:hypothetical protein
MNNKEQIGKWAAWVAKQPKHNTTYTYRNTNGQIIAILTPKGDTIENFAEVMATLLEAATREPVMYSISQNVERNINVDRPYWPPQTPA